MSEQRLVEIAEDVKEIRKVLTDNTFRMAEYNAQLTVHIQGVKDLQARISPIEEHVVFIRKLMRLATWVLGILAAFSTIARYFLINK